MSRATAAMSEQPMHELRPSDTTTLDSRQPVPWAVRRWAIEELAIAEGANAADDANFADIDATFFKLLAENHFVPMERTALAYEVLRDTDAEQCISTELVERAVPFLNHVEHQLREEIEEFCAAFPYLSHGERERRLDDFKHRCSALPVLMTRLDELSEAVTLDLQSLDDESKAVRDLSTHVVDLYLRWPTRRGAMRFMPRDDVHDTVAEWPAAARRLQSRHKQIASLEPAFVAEWADAESRRKQMQRQKRLKEPRIKFEQPKVAKRNTSKWWMILVIAGSVTSVLVKLDQNPNKRWAATQATRQRNDANEAYQKMLKRNQALQGKNQFPASHMAIDGELVPRTDRSKPLETALPSGYLPRPSVDLGNSQQSWQKQPLPEIPLPSGLPPLPLP